MISIKTILTTNKLIGIALKVLSKLTRAKRNQSVVDPAVMLMDFNTEQQIKIFVKVQYWQL